MSHDGLVALPSPHDFATTLGSLLAVLKEKSITVFACVDHAAGAAGVGLALRPTTVVLFGNPKAGTPLMQAAQTAGIDLPLKVLVWQAADGSVKLSYNDPHWITARHGLGGAVAQAVAAMAGGLERLIRQAAG
jgi:uncharacterized protein (DUF302 family)